MCHGRRQCWFRLNGRVLNDGSRTGVLGAVAKYLCGHALDRPLLVGVDGICGAGKSTFTRDLAGVIDAMGRSAVVIDSDGFHNTRVRRYSQGRDSARGYYEHAYDFESLADRVLRPLRFGDSLEYAWKVLDLETDEVVVDAVAVAPRDAVVLFDATFVQAAMLDGLWDEVIYLDADEAAAFARGVARDADALGGVDAARAAYESRYMEACRIYLKERDPRSRASIVIEHTDPTAPVVVTIGS